MHNEPRKSPPPDAGSSLPVKLSPESSGALKDPKMEQGGDAGPVEAPTNPAWAKDLRELYNAVVEEPLPDSFIDLLSQLDSED